MASLRDQWARVQLGEDTPLGRDVVRRLAGPLAAVPAQVQAIVHAPSADEAAWDLLLEAETDHRVLTHLGPITGTPYTSAALLRAIVQSLDAVARLGAKTAGPLQRDRAHRLLRAIHTAGGPTPDAPAPRPSDRLSGRPNSRPGARPVAATPPLRPATQAPGPTLGIAGASRRVPTIAGQPLAVKAGARRSGTGSTRKELPALSVKQFLARFGRGRSV